MCMLCEKVKRENRGYTFCPYCGENFRNGFIPNYIHKRTYTIGNVDSYGRPIGLYYDTLSKIRK